jgi:hypothetical protein
MQNGKHAVVRGLIDSIGFGSTEFHVIRCLDEIIPEWVHFFLRRKETLDAAQKTFTGAVGQQRVPKIFLEELKIPVPPVSEQLRNCARLKAQLAEVEKARKAAEVQLHETFKLTDAFIYQAFEMKYGVYNKSENDHTTQSDRLLPLAVRLCQIHLRYHAPLQLRQRASVCAGIDLDSFFTHSGYAGGKRP